MERYKSVTPHWLFSFNGMTHGALSVRIITAKDINVYIK